MSTLHLIVKVKEKKDGYASKLHRPCPLKMAISFLY